jgi:hypothetical protein
MGGFRFVGRAWLVALSAAAISLAGVVTFPAEASAAAPPWGACGISTDDNKLVRQFPVNQRLNFYLRCGNEAKGYRHILLRHRTDFEAMAFGTNENWRDVADLAMASIASDPDQAIPVGDGKGCYSRVLFLRNNRTNQVVRQQIFRMIVIIGTGEIISVYPHGQQCR